MASGGRAGSSGEGSQKAQRKMKTEMEDMKMPAERIEAAKAYVEEHGAKHLGEFLKKQIDEFKECKVNIAITGGSGQGKSSFINLIRGLKRSDRGAAKVGVTETTMEPKSFAHPDMPNMLFWDLPGCGTETFKKDEYVADMKLNVNYDAFIICGSTRFTDNDMMIARAAHQGDTKVPFYIVRTKIDIDIENEREDNDDFDESELLGKVRADVYKNLRKAEFISLDDVFLISTKLKYQHRWDYPKLITKLMENAPQQNQEAMVMALKNTSQAGLELKKGALLNRIPGVIAAIRNSDEATSKKMLDEELETYTQQFNLTKGDMENLNIGREAQEELLSTVASMTNKIWWKKALKLVHILNPIGRIADAIINRNIIGEVTDDIARDEDSVSAKLADFLKEAMDKYVGLGIEMIAKALEI